MQYEEPIISFYVTLITERKTEKEKGRKIRHKCWVKHDLLAGGKLQCDQLAY